jgi:amidophosphoribosyltransferase
VLETEKPRCECGVFGIYAPDLDVSREACLALQTLQHRGHESAGIAVNNGGVIERHSGKGLVTQVFSRKEILDGLRGEFAIGHNRYSTTGGGGAENEHPFRANGHLGELAIAHNGNLTNPEAFALDLARWGIPVTGTTDSELAALWIAHVGGDTWEENIQAFMEKAEGAYSMAVLTERSMYAFRDPHGVRPLQIARTGADGWAVSSETLTFRTLGYRPYREVSRGELIRIDAEGFRTISHQPAEREALCVFEYIYFSRPDSELSRKSINRIRKHMGRELANESPVDVDVVTPVPQSGNPFAEGFADELGLHHEVAFARNAYFGRSFIDPNPEERRRIVEMKLNPFVDVVRGKRVCLVDDSLVRGNTMPIIVDMLWDAGATEVHVRIGSPPLVDTCHLGVDIPTKEELAAHNQSVEQILADMKAHSLAYLSEDGMYRAVRRSADTVCAACMTGERPFAGATPRHAH